jgi:hypothetical protein
MFHPVRGQGLRLRLLFFHPSLFEALVPSTRDSPMSFSLHQGGDKEPSPTTATPTTVITDPLFQNRHSHSAYHSKACCSAI